MEGREIVGLLPNRNETCLLIKSAFDQSFCRKIIQTYHERFLPATSLYPTHYRNNERQVKDDPIFASQLFEHIQDYIPQTLEANGNNPQENGKWKVLGLNERLRICRYKAGQYFNRHLDGIHYRTSTIQSKLTFMIYLNGEEDFEGGRTMFFNDNNSDNLLVSYTPQQGDLIIFDHNLWHAGEEVKSGEKYVLRSDILYERISSIERDSSQPFGEGHLGYIWKILSTENEIITCGRDKKIKVWNQEGMKITEWQAHENSVLDLIKPTKDTLISCSRDQYINIWKKHKDGYGIYQKIHAHRSTILSLCELNHEAFASSSAEGMINIYDYEGNLKEAIKGHEEWIWQLGKISDNLLASIGEDGYVKIWQYNPLSLISTFKLNWPLTTMSYDVEKSILYVGGTEGKIIGLRYTEKEGLRPFLEHSCHQGKVCTIKINQKYIVTGGEDNKVVIWEKIGLKKLYEYEHINFVQDLILMKDKITSVSYDGKIMIHYI